MSIKERKEKQLQGLCSHPELEKSGGGMCRYDSHCSYGSFLYVCRKCGHQWNLYQCSKELDEKVVIDTVKYCNKQLRDYMQEKVKENIERMGK
jgi:hypothetical protein